MKSSELQIIIVVALFTRYSSTSPLQNPSEWLAQVTQEYGVSVDQMRSVLDPNVDIILMDSRGQLIEGLETEAHPPTPVPVIDRPEWADHFHMDLARFPRDAVDEDNDHPDFIDQKRELTFGTQVTSRSAANTNNDRPIGVVETLIVCDKEWGDLFNHDYQKIRDYWTVYFWDVNHRYKTLPSSDLSILITGIVVISDTSEQSFIEDARNDQGIAEYGRILDRFAKWVYQRMNQYPKFDIAVAVTNTRVEWGGGLAIMHGACDVRHDIGDVVGRVVFSDAGTWNSLTVGTHEIAHTLGAYHDNDTDGGHPGGCNYHGYIQSGGLVHKRFFFSECSDRTIAEFLRSDQSSCLRRQDESDTLPIPWPYTSPLSPSMDDQCKRRHGNESRVHPSFQADCIELNCQTPEGNGGWNNYRHGEPADNAQCQNAGRCFRGRCRARSTVIRNVGVDQCMRASNPFNHSAGLELIPCAEAWTPINQFVITEDQHGQIFATPWSSSDAEERGDKCVYTSDGEGRRLWTDRCDSSNPWHGWDIRDVGNAQFLLVHRLTNRCAKVDGSEINVYESCNRNDRNMLWQRS